MIDALTRVHFLHPGWLWVWPLSAFVVGLLLRRGALGALSTLPEWFGATRYRHPRTAMLRGVQEQTGASRATRQMLLRWVEYAVPLLCIHLALAQPYRIGPEVPKPPEYRDTLFVIDASVTMLLRDYVANGQRIDRMTVLKNVLTHFIDQLKGNRIGLVVFSEQAYMLAPLTADYGLLESRVQRLEPAVLTGRTSDISKALEYTLQQLQEMRATKAAQKPVVVLVTDVNWTYRDRDPRAIATYLHEQGYHLYTVGIGAASERAREQGAVAHLLYEPLNIALLKQIAHNGGGRFYWANDTRNLQAAVEAIQSGERRPVVAAPRYIRLPLYPWPLSFGLAWIAVSQFARSLRRRA